MTYMLLQCKEAGNISITLHIWIQTRQSKSSVSYKCDPSSCSMVSILFGTMDERFANSSVFLESLLFNLLLAVPSVCDVFQYQAEPYSGSSCRCVFGLNYDSDAWLSFLVLCTLLHDQLVVTVSLLMISYIFLTCITGEVFVAVNIHIVIYDTCSMGGGVVPVF